MELYNFYRMGMWIATLFVRSTNLLPVFGSIGAVLIWLIAFIFQGVGVSKMAKKRGIENTWLAFVPFVNIWYIGKLAGECQFFGQRLKRVGMYAMIAQIFAALSTIVVIAAETYLWLKHGQPQIEPQLGTPYWTGLTGFSATVSRFYDLSGYLLSIVQLICQILLVMLLMGLYRQYQPKNYTMLSLLSLLIPISRYFIIFALRERKAVDYEAYMRARQEAFMRRRQQYYNPNNPPYGGPYNGQYGNPYAGYGQNGGGAPKKEEEPFAEFSSNAKTEPSTDTDKKSDDFFN